MRAASSKGAADLIALWPAPNAVHPRVWLVQCKRDGKLPQKEWHELCRIADHTAARPVLAKTDKNGRGVAFVFLDAQD